MPDLGFQIEGAEVVANAAAPLLAFKLRLNCADPEQTIHTVALRCQHALPDAAVAELHEGPQPGFER